MYVFAYGSLMDPASLRRTLPRVALGGCRPARCVGYQRSFSVAFPNDGSQGDKAYLDATGRRPPVVLFCDLQPLDGPGRDDRAGVLCSAEAVDPGTEFGSDVGAVDGVCVPVDAQALDALRRRERRYDLVELTASVRFEGDRSPAQGVGDGTTPVLGFIGKPEFRRPADVARGVVAADYLASVIRGARYWQRGAAGKSRDADDPWRGTLLPDPTRVRDLRRVDPVDPGDFAR